MGRLGFSGVTRLPVRLFAIAISLAIALTSAPAAAREEQLLQAQMHSGLLSAFFNRDVGIVASILLPDDYYKAPGRRFPTIYVVHAFGDSHFVDSVKMLEWQRAQRADHVEFIVVFLDANINEGHHVFADSENYGPWGTALVTEFIPQTDKHFRTVADPRARFVSGHSSGGWSSLWLQISHPDVFGGVWSISPDPVDFHDFTGPDLTLQPPGNFYRDARGNAYTIERRGGHDTMPLERLVNRVPWGIAQFNSFEEVFSPRGRDGKPEPLFDRRSGAIDPNVAFYWEKHWDVDRVLSDRWPTIGPQLRGKIHVFVGTEDTFHLDRPVRLMRDELAKLDGEAQFTFVPGADHWSVYAYDHDLVTEIVREMAGRLPSPNPNAAYSGH